jgi:Tfp pilus assembly protein PilV
MLVTKRTLCHRMRPLGLLRLCARPSAKPRSERGDTLIEVLISSVILALIVVGTLTGVDSANRATSFDRNRSQATALAQQDEDRMRSLPIKKLSELSETHEVVQHEVNASGTKYTIASTAKYVADKTSTASCTSTSIEADYIETTSTVSWGGSGGSKVIQNGVISPPPDSALIVQVLNQSAEALPKMTVSVIVPATGAQAVTAQTSADGCAILAVEPGEYTLNVLQTGYVDENGYSESDKDPISDTPFYVVAEQTIKKGYKFAVGGALAVKFENPVSKSTAEEGDTFVAANTGMNPSFRQFGTVSTPAAPTYSEIVESKTASVTNPKTVFPFSSSYTVYAGTCESDKPPRTILENPLYSKNFSAVVSPGSTTSVTTLQPPISVKVLESNKGITPEKALANGTVRLEDSGCKTVHESSTTSAGALSHPSMPFGTYSLCVTAIVNGKHRKYTTSVANNSLSGVTVPTIYLGEEGKEEAGCP